MFPMKMMRGVQTSRFLKMMKMRSALNAVLSVTMSEMKTEPTTEKKLHTSHKDFLENIPCPVVVEVSFVICV